MSTKNWTKEDWKAFVAYWEALAQSLLSRRGS